MLGHKKQAYLNMNYVEIKIALKLYLSVYSTVFCIVPSRLRLPNNNINVLLPMFWIITVNIKIWV